MPHAVLLGDSIFDNALYVPDGPPVADQLRAALPSDWRVTLLAVDGDVTLDVTKQLRGLPADASHLLVSCGGNDALGCLQQLTEPADTVAGALQLLSGIREEFRRNYRQMLGSLPPTGNPPVCCTIYDSIPGYAPAIMTALSLFNEVILREGVAAGATLVDLRQICTDEDDYSDLSPIEPSEKGGAKIAAALSRVLLGADAPVSRVGIYA